MTREYSLLMDIFKGLKDSNPNSSIEPYVYITVDMDGNVVFSDNPYVFDKKGLDFCIAYFKNIITPEFYDGKGGISPEVSRRYTYFFDKYGQVYEDRYEKNGLALYMDGREKWGLTQDDKRSWVVSYAVKNPINLLYALKIMDATTEVERKYLKELRDAKKEIQELKGKNIALEAAKNTYKEFIDYLTSLMHK